MNMHTWNLKSRKAVSQIIGSVFMLAIVAAFGSILMFQGLQGSRDLTDFVDIFNKNQGESVKEGLAITHVRFDPNSDFVSIWVRNTGDIDFVIDKIAIVRIDTQALIVNNETAKDQIFVGQTKRSEQARSGTVTLPTACTKWDCTDANGKRLQDSEYRISIVTSRGNAFEIVAKPFNT